MVRVKMSEEVVAVVFIVKNNKSITNLAKIRQRLVGVVKQLLFLIVDKNVSITTINHNFYF